MKSKKRKGTRTVAPICPYCGSHAILRSADGIYSDNRGQAMLYVCKNYPRCDSYVRVQAGTSIPLGTLANRELRSLRTETHKRFDLLYKEGYMTREDAYEWLVGILGTTPARGHIGYLSEISCKVVMNEADKLLSWYRQKKRANLVQGGSSTSCN